MAEANASLGDLRTWTHHVFLRPLPSRQLRIAATVTCSRRMKLASQNVVTSALGITFNLFQAKKKDPPHQSHSPNWKTVEGVTERTIVQYCDYQFNIMQYVTYNLLFNYINHTVVPFEIFHQDWYQYQETDRATSTDAYTDVLTEASHLSRS